MLQLIVTTSHNKHNTNNNDDSNDEERLVARGVLRGGVEDHADGCRFYILYKL